MLLKNERLKKSRTRPGAGQMADENKDWKKIFKLMAKNFANELI